jgi:glycosyltransferase involved in cell wall biosynthesis
MRIVIDLQGAQSESRSRGIGRYSLSLAQAMVRNCGNHEIIIVLSGLFPDSIEPIRAAFEGLISQENIRVWNVVGPVHFLDSSNNWRRQCAELVREVFLENLQPDIIHISSMFEGFGDNAIQSIGANSTSIPTAVTLYDLIPLMQSETYLKPNPTYEKFYREKLAYLKKADLYLAISDSSRMEAISHLSAKLEQVVNISAAADTQFKPVSFTDLEKTTIKERFELTRPFLMYSGATDERKNHLRLIKAFSLLPLSLRNNFQLVIVGKLPDAHKEKFKTHATQYGLNPTDIVITGQVTDQEMLKLYNLCELFVFPSWHEGFGLPALEAMSCGAAVICSNTSSLPEVIGRQDAMFDPFDEKSISQKINEVLTNSHLRSSLAQHGLQQAKKFSWDKSAKIAITAFEQWHKKQTHENTTEIDARPSLSSIPSLVEKIAKISNPPSDENFWIKTAQAIAQNNPESSVKKLLVDISELVNRDAKSGIQRVVRSILSELLTNPPTGFTVEPVYATTSEPGYRYARKFTRKLLNRIDNQSDDAPIETFCGDIFLGLDLQHHVVLRQADFYSHLRRIGVQVYFVVYDLLPIRLQRFFSEQIPTIHAQWLNTLAQHDGVICITRAVADDMSDWLSEFGPNRLRPFKVGWFHLGADVAQSVPTKGLPSGANRMIADISSRPTFLMVGTIEPRKGQMQTLEAFDRLWDQGIKVNLVMVGKHGWNVDRLISNMQNHTERNRHLFWLDGISDEYLEKIYAASTCLIAASEGEGFGLPLIEAAQHNLPIIARDIPVFREVAGEHAFYFSGLDPLVMANAVKEWLALDKIGNAPRSDKMQWLTWAESNQQLIDVILKDKWSNKWMSDGGFRYFGSDARLSSQVGKPYALTMQTVGVAGYLLHGPYLELHSGHYQIKLYGQVKLPGTPSAYVDIAIRGASEILHSDALKVSEQAGLIAEMEIFLNTTVTDFEVRVWAPADSDLYISKVEIFPESLFTKEISLQPDFKNKKFDTQVIKGTAINGYLSKNNSPSLRREEAVSEQLGLIREETEIALSPVLLEQNNRIDK